MAQAVSRGPLTAEAQIRARISVGFVVGKVTLGQVFSKFFGFTLSVSFHRRFPYPYIIWGMNNRPVSGRSSETQSHPIDLNNNKLRVFRNGLGLSRVTRN
jgi:hypothetical protein